MTMTSEQKATLLRQNAHKGGKARAQMAQLKGPTNEAALRAEICKALRQMGWKAIDTSQDTPARGGMAGFPDIIAFKRGRTLLIETKHGRNDLNESQQKFGTDIAQHLDPRTLHYCVARSLDDVLRVLGLTV
jgi:hypothetical protein